MEILGLFGAGALAGLGVAVPLGAIGLLLVRQGVAGGFVVGAAGAAAVALVDSVYCIVALGAGAVVAPVLGEWGAAAGLLAGAMLMALGVAGLLRERRRPTASQDQPGRSSVRRPAPARFFLLLLGLTAVNPATLLYFAALTTALRPTLAAPGGAVAATAFVAGVAIASLAWQLGLVAAGAFWGGRITPRGQVLVGRAGYLLVILLGAGAALAALAAPSTA
ncbi:LysE family transporter [Cryobacterium sp. PAMC25264]|uniref:LysE family transporter n=1 Tax=Cryobacterium sp. PAMC25264 TaxID=2861288 RepID=UPI001C62E27D|nr:LysE family transporter [Cryobacterium sp. PAMC25264]QYF72779.1 LysE family transporter [Cryobacterium sp. PAMC25264]